MPSVYDLKPRFQGLLRPAMSALHRAGVTPNSVTAAGIVGSIAVGLAVPALALRSSPLWLLAIPVWMFLRMALNAIDGMMAREFSLCSKTGEVLNELGDAVCDIFAYLPLAFFRPDALLPLAAFALAAVLTEFGGVLSKAMGGERVYGGPMGKSDRAFAVGTVATATAVWPGLTEWWPTAFWALAALAVVTIANRVRASLAAGQGA